MSFSEWRDSPLERGSFYYLEEFVTFFVISLFFVGICLLEIFCGIKAGHPEDYLDHTGAWVFGLSDIGLSLILAAFATWANKTFP